MSDTALAPSFGWLVVYGADQSVRCTSSAVQKQLKSVGRILHGKLKVHFRLSTELQAGCGDGIIYTGFIYTLAFISYTPGGSRNRSGGKTFFLCDLRGPLDIASGTGADSRAGIVPAPKCVADS